MLQSGHDFLSQGKWPWRFRSRSKVIVCDTPSYGSDHLWLIWKESIQNCRCYRADTIFKAKAEWPWRYRSRSKVIICNTPSHTSDHLCEIWKESIENCRFFFSRSRREKFQKFAKNSNFQILKKRSNTTHHLMIVIICAKFKNNPSRTVDATERTRFPKSRPNDLEDIGQGQRSLCVTHPLMGVINCG